MRAKSTFELAADIGTIGHLDLGDEPIEPKPYGGIADPVTGGQLLEGARGQHQTLDERKILVAEVVDPAQVAGFPHINNSKAYIHYIFNKKKLNIIFVDWSRSGTLVVASQVTCTASLTLALVNDFKRVAFS